MGLGGHRSKQRGRFHRHLSALLISTALAALSVAPAIAETPGKDGSLTVSGTQVLNEYAAITTAASSGATNVSVSSLAANLPSLSVDDLVMIYQANGASINTSDDGTYGAVTSYNNAG